MFEVPGLPAQNCKSYDLSVRAGLEVTCEDARHVLCVLCFVACVQHRTSISARRNPDVGE